MVGRRAPEERLNDTKSTDVKVGIHNLKKEKKRKKNGKTPDRSTL